MLLSPGKSIFIYAPIALVAFVAIPWAIRRRPAEVVLLLSIALINLAIFARIAIWSGDEAWGPRYMLVALPLFALILAPVMDHDWWPGATAIAGALGVIVAVLSIVVHPLRAYNVAAATYGVDAVDATGTAKYIDALHFRPGASPPLAHLRLLPDVVGNTADELSDPAGADGRGQPFPDRVDRRYSWTPERASVDIWWIGWERRGIPPWALLLAVPLAGAGVVGAGLTRGRA